MDEESHIHFPCDFPIKVMGKNNEQFEVTVLGIIKSHFPKLQQDALTLRTSRDSNYLSLTVTVFAENKASLDALYEELSNCDLVLMAL